MASSALAPSKRSSAFARSARRLRTLSSWPRALLAVDPAAELGAALRVDLHVQQVGRRAGEDLGQPDGALDAVRRDRVVAARALEEDEALERVGFTSAARRRPRSAGRQRSTRCALSATRRARACRAGGWCPSRRARRTRPRARGPRRTGPAGPARPCRRAPGATVGIAPGVRSPSPAIPRIPMAVSRTAASTMAMRSRARCGPERSAGGTPLRLAHPRWGSDQSVVVAAVAAAAARALHLERDPAAVRSGARWPRSGSCPCAGRRSPRCARSGCAT